jgi:hypothetical protein
MNSFLGDRGAGSWLNHLVPEHDDLDGQIEVVGPLHEEDLMVRRNAR